MKPTITASDIVHENPWYTVRHDELTWPNGKPGNYYVCEFRPAACVIAIQAGNILVTQQYRYTQDRVCTELPMGGGDLNELPETTARREFKEETGYEADTWRQLGVVQRIVGACKAPLHIFLATGLTHTNGQHLDASEEDLKTRWIPIAEWEQLIRQGEVVDASSIAAYGLYLIDSQ